MKSYAWIALGFLMGLVACATSPLGRKQLILMPSGQMSAMGVQAFGDMKSKVPVEADPKMNQYVRCVANAILEAMDSSPQEWEVVVFKDKTANAFALPGKKIGVHTGLLPVAKTPSQLAAVLGHEVGHVIANHGNERVSEAFAVQGGIAVASVAMNQKNSSYPLVMAGLGLGAQFGVLLPHSRSQESEADLIGLDLMAKAGFDPRESVELWKNMAASGGGQPPEFLSTHPSHGTRMTRLQENMPQALETSTKAQAAGRHPACQL